MTHCWPMISWPTLQTYKSLPPATAVQVIQSFPSVCLCVWVCGTYFVHHFNGTELCCAPPTCNVHHEKYIGVTPTWFRTLTYGVTPWCHVTSRHDVTWHHSMTSCGHLRHSMTSVGQKTMKCMHKLCPMVWRHVTSWKDITTSCDVMMS